MKWAKSYGLLTFSLLLAVQFLDAYGREPTSPGSRYLSARGAAMGGAFLPLPDDGPGVLFVNPAAIGNTRGWHAEPMNLLFEANGQFIDSLNKDAYKFISLPAYKKALQNKSGRFPGLGVQYTPTFYSRYIAFGAMGKERISARHSNGNIRYVSDYEIIPAIGTGVSLAQGIVRLGYSLQYVSKAKGDVTVPETSADLGYNKNLKKGAALSHTAAFAFTLPFKYLPSWNIVARNIGGAKYHSGGFMPLAESSTGLPPTEKMSIDGSFSISPKVGNGAQFNLVSQITDSTNTSGLPIMARLAFGLEWAFRNSIFVRGGWGSGYPSAGFGIRRPKGEFNLTWFNEEVGNGYHDQKEVRYLFQYQLRAF